MNENKNKTLRIIPQVRRLTNTQDLAVVAAAAKYNNHQVFYPTHYVIKDSEIIGCFNVAPTVHWWMHSEKATTWDSLFAIGVLETLLKEAGISDYIMPIADESPYMSIIEKAGFEKGASVSFYRKRI